MERQLRPADPATRAARHDHPMMAPLLFVLALASSASAQTPAGAPLPLAGSEPPAIARNERQEIRAQLMPLRYTTLASEIGARIRKLPFPESRSFKAGDVLAVLDCSVQQAQRNKARAELAGAEATLKANEQLASLNSISELELILAGVAMQRARAEIAAHEALLEKCSLVAPFNGRVAEQKVREQQFVQPGQALMDILDDSALELEFLAPSNWITWLRPGYPLSATIDETGRTYAARLVRIGARVDPVSQTVKVAAAIDGRFPELMAGMSGQVQVPPPRP
jgi:membrane fusion protein (multidrug efflux system)